jgi:hypothetical protein
MFTEYYYIVLLYSVSSMDMLLFKVSQEIWYSNLLSCFYVPSQYTSDVNSD